MSKHWKVFKASSEKFRDVARTQLEREGYTEWQGSIKHKDVPAGIWEQYLLENLANKTEVRLLGFKEQL